MVMAMTNYECKNTKRNRYNLIYTLFTCQSGPQGPPPPYPSPGGPVKRFKSDIIEQKSPDQIQQLQQQPSFYMTPQQHQMLQYLQQNSANLNSLQQNMLHQLQNQYRLMQQHQQQVRQQRPAGIGAVQQRTGAGVVSYSSSVQSPQSQTGAKHPLNTVIKNFPIGANASVSNVRIVI